MSLFDAASEIVLAALDRSGAARDEFIAATTRNNPPLEREVRSLLDAHARSDGFLESPDAAATAGRQIGPYRLLGVLGEGGMGVVYLAEDSRLGRTVALKAIARQFTHDEPWRERLRREARAAAALAHPGIAVVHALEDIDGRLYIVSEHIRGETLRDAMADGPLPVADVIAIGRQLADALAAAHDSGVVHRDLKPENVMRGPDGGVKILDFGLAKLSQKAEGRNREVEVIGREGGSAHSVAGAVFGTPAYMSPEQLRGETATAASDIFALGVMLAELSSGRHPFGGEHKTATMARVLSSEPDVAGVPGELRPVILGCLAKVPDERFRSAHEVRAALDTIARGGSLRIADRQGQDAFWWWQFHQASACAFSAVMITWVGLSLLRTPNAWGDAIFVGAVIGGTSAVTLRLYALFVARTRASDPAPQKAALVARAGDLVLAVAAFAEGFADRFAHPVAAALLMCAAVVMTVVNLVIEPATARAARR